MAKSDHDLGNGSAYESEGESQDASKKRSMAKGAPGADAQTAAFVGKVVESMDAGSYTYVQLEGNGQKVWVAGPQTVVSKGDKIGVTLDTPMRDFESPSLNRRFDVVYFVTSLGPSSGSGGDSPMASSQPMASGNPHAGLKQFETPEAAGSIDLQSIEKPAGGYRIAEVYAKRGDWAGKEVVVRGRVVKYNSGIMGRAWVHIRDGSGDSQAGTHDLCVTTQDVANIGDLVTVRGVVAVDKDFGAGYRYDVIVEEASVKVESRL